MFKVQEGDYVETSGMNEAKRREVVQALLDCGVGEGEGFAHANNMWGMIGVHDGGVFYDDYVEDRCLTGRKLTLSDLRSPEWDGNGLPPVGVECELDMSEYRDKGYTSDNWRSGDVVQVVAHKQADTSEVAIVWNTRTRTSDSLIPEFFRPIKTESQREREELYSLVDKAYMDGAKKHSGGLAAITDALIKAGYKKVTK